jgi:hypothetical protein
VIFTDGGLYISTPVDVLLVLLPYLEKSRNKVMKISSQFVIVSA